MLMRDIYNVADLNKELRGLGEQVIPMTANSLVREGRKYVTKMVYQKYRRSPQLRTYSRTYQLRNKFTNLGDVSLESNKIDYAIGYNLDELSYSSVVPGYTANGALIPRLVEEGTTGAMFKKGKWYDQSYYNEKTDTFAQPRPFFKTFSKDVGDRLFIEHFEKALQKTNVTYEKGE